MSKVSVWAKIPLQPGKRDEAVAVLSEHAIANVQGEEGTLAYILNVDPNDDSALYFYEIYADADALKTHGSSDGMKALGGLLAGLVAGRPELTILSPVAGTGL